MKLPNNFETMPSAIKNIHAPKTLNATCTAATRFAFVFTPILDKTAVIQVPIC